MGCKWNKFQNFFPAWDQLIAINSTVAKDSRETEFHNVFYNKNAIKVNITSIIYIYIYLQKIFRINKNMNDEIELVYCINHKYQLLKISKCQVYSPILKSKGLRMIRNI
jgi:hypothetical protein